MKNKCINCGESTKSMYHMNEGLYCEKHKELGSVIQKYNLETKRFEERLKMFSKGWSNRIVTFTNFEV
jgi:hypothetical protein